MTSGPQNRRTLFVALLIGGCTLAWRLGGPEPRLWADTLGDQRLVRDCLDLGRCDFPGIHASVEGVHVGAGWELGRTLLEWLGTSPTQVHRGLNLLEGLVVPLAGLAALEVAGPTAALLSALGIGVAFGAIDVQHDVLYNTRPAAFAGALFLLLALQAVRRRRLALLALAAAVAAVATNLHPVNGFLGVSAFLVAGLFPPARARRRRRADCAAISRRSRSRLGPIQGRRLRALAVVLAAFGLTLVAGAPRMWIENARLLLGGWSPGAAFAVPTSAPVGLGFLPWALAALGALAWVATRDPPHSPGREGALALLAAVAPMLAVFAASTLAGAVPASDKYLDALVAPVAVSLGVAGERALSGLRALVARGRPGAHFPEAARPLLGRVAPWAVAAAVALWPVPRIQGFEGGFVGRAQLTLTDVEALAGALPGATVDPASLYVALDHPARTELLSALAILAPPTTAPADAPGPPPLPDLTRLLVLKSLDNRLPDPVPPGWTVLRRSAGSALVLARVDGWIDRDRFEVCDSPAADGSPSPCREIAYRADPGGPGVAPAGMPDLPAGRHATLTLRFPLRIPASGVHEVRFPPLPGLCPGRIVDVRGGSVSLAPDGLRARIVAEGPGESLGSLTVSWDADGRDGLTCFYDGFPPFFLEGEPAVLDAVETSLGRWPDTGRAAP